MSYQNRWLLPAGITEALPKEARHLETLRRQLLDLYQTWGYEQVMPPMIEYLDSLLVNANKELDLKTFKLTDQLTGKLMGIRADMTPQVARIDAHYLKHRGDIPNRLCYLGTVLHTYPDSFTGLRSPFQVGAELYGHQGVTSDAEILSLMLETLHETHITDYHVDIGHVGVYEGLLQQMQLYPTQEELLFDAVQRKASCEIKEFLTEWKVPPLLQTMMQSLIELNGDEDILREARQCFEHATTKVHQALDYLDTLSQHFGHVDKLHFDLAEVSGFHYYTGTVFAAYIAGHGQAIAQGGRYDGIGREFGRSRPAVGFSTDLRALVSLQPSIIPKISAIFAPAVSDNALTEKIRELRHQGHKIICELEGQQSDAKAMKCDHCLELVNGDWQVTALDD